MIFRFMEKHRVGILLVILVTMVGFGFWSYLVDYFNRRDSGEVDAGKIMASFTLFGETVEVPKERLERAGFSWMSVRDMRKRDAEARLARVIQDAVLESDAAYPVSDELVRKMIQDRLITPLKRQNNGQFGEKEMLQLASAYRMTWPEFKAQARRDLLSALTFRELDRPGRAPTTQQVYERYAKDFQLLKLKGIFWDTEAYLEKSRLPRDDKDNLTAQSEQLLKKYWDEKSDEEKQKFNKKFALIDTEFLGFDFEQYDSDDALAQAFMKVDAKSGRSLEQLTADLKVTDAELANMKVRLERHRAAYGLAQDDDIEKVLQDRNKRWVQEIKILKLVKKVHDGLMTALRKGEKPDYARAAADNNLTYHVWKKRHVLDLRDAGVAFQSVILFGLNSAAVKPGDIYEYKPLVGPNSAWFFRGPVDQPGRFCASYRLLNRIDKPIPAFEGDVKKDVLALYEQEKADKLRDEIYDRFKGKLDAITEEKAKDEIAKIKAETEKAIADAIKDLDPEKDKDKIKEITDEQNEDAKSLIEAEKDKYRDEAFAKVLEENADEDIGIIVEEGFFEPFFAVREGKITATLTSEERARSSLRSEFGMLHDQGARKEYHKVGETTPLAESRHYKGLKGMAMIVAKKAPSFEDMLLHPMRMLYTEMNLRREMLQDLAESNMWSVDAMKTLNFNIETAELDKQIEENLQREKERDEGIRKYEEEMERQKKAHEAARKAAMEGAGKKKPDAEGAGMKLEGEPGKAPDTAGKDG